MRHAAAAFIVNIPIPRRVDFGADYVSKAWPREVINTAAGSGRADRVPKKQHRPKICGIPPWAPTVAVFLVAKVIGASGEAIGAFPQFARVLSSVVQEQDW